MKLFMRSKNIAARAKEAGRMGGLRLNPGGVPEANRKLT